MNLLPHIAERVFAAPLMIARPKLDVILGVLAPRLQGHPLAPKEAVAPRSLFEVTAEGVAIIPVAGTLVRRATGLEAQSGLTSYGGLSEQIAEATADSSIRAILLDVDSSGGEAGGVFDLADQIFAARQVKPVWAVANESAFSAAYALAASAEKIYVTRTGGVGSIGVIAVHLDQSQADEQDGFKYTAIFAGEHKNDYSPHEPLTDPARASLQKEVDRVYGLFAQSVARGRGLSLEAVQKTEAALLFGKDALTAGLSDRVGTFETALADLTVSLSPNSPSFSLTTSRKAKTMTTQENQPQIEAEKELPDLEAMKADLTEKARAEAKAEAMAYVAEVHDLCALAGAAHRATDFIVKGMAIESIRRELLEAKAKTSEATTLTGHIPPQQAQAAAKIDTAAIYAKRNNKQGE
jgi:signal peptide peptidase SppA